MKKLCIMILTLLTLMLPCYAADTVTQTLTMLNSQNAYKWTLAVTDDATDNVVSTAMDTAIFNALRGWYMYQVTWDPGATAPDATTDLVFTVAGGTTNLAGTDLDNLSATLTTKVLLPNFYCLDELIYFSTTGQTVDNATYSVEAIFAR